MRRLLAFLLIIGVAATVALARGHSSSTSGSSGKSVHVEGYTRKDGTYVAPYERRAPGTATGQESSSSSSVKSSPSTSTDKAPATGSISGEPKRDAKGHIERSEAAKDAFKRSHPCPANGNTHGACPGYVIDHVKALKHGGADDPTNMQWQTIEQAKAKDKLE